LSRNEVFCTHETTCSKVHAKGVFAWKKHMLKVFRSKQAYTDAVLRRGVARALPIHWLSKNGRCFVHMKRRVQRCMLKAFLLGRNICWRCFARNKHILMGYYEEKC